jgi:hypothetical protein
MAGGYKQIHKHPNAGANSLRERKHDINKSGKNRKSFTSFNEKCKEAGIEKLNQSNYLETLSYLVSLTQIEISELANDQEQPLYLRLMIAELTDPQTRGRTIQDFRDYLFHKGVIQTEQTTTIINLGDGINPNETST